MSVIGCLVAVLPAPAVAQSTDTERAAAREVVQQIDALQARLKPTDAGRRMAGKKDADRDRLFQRIDQLWTGEMRDLSDYIGKHPEVGFKEYQSVDTLTTVLRGHGFQIEKAVAGLETAFVGSWDSPAGTSGPTLGVIVEYDALRSTSEPFHGCQHNAQSPVGFATAIAIADYMKEKRLPGRIKVFGTPAEEVGPPTKVTMWEAGIFKGTDILVRSHGAGATSRSRAGFGVCCLNINEVRYIFTGRSSVQLSYWFGRNSIKA
jgi:metal-dependent amidase/aminoacylase/carboxypeptidase family protein